MANYPACYLLCGYRVQLEEHWLVAEEKKAYSQNRSNRYGCSIALSNEDSVEVKFFTGNNLGRFLIISDSRKRAYGIANTIRSWLGAVCDMMPSDTYGFYLQELELEPERLCSIDTVRQNLMWVDEQDHYGLWNDLYGGITVYGRHLRQLQAAGRFLYEHKNIRKSLQLLFESLRLYNELEQDYHFFFDALSCDEKEALLAKMYYENGLRYESAFLVAFKALERFLGVSQLKKHRIVGLMKKNQPLIRVAHNELYERRYEHREAPCHWIGYADLIKMWLDIRNATAAHSNITPPQHLMVTAGNVKEIQVFLARSIMSAVCSSAR